MPFAGLSLWLPDELRDCFVRAVEVTRLGALLHFSGARLVPQIGQRACLREQVLPRINLRKRRGNLLGLRCRKPSVLRITFGLGYHAGGANRVDEREE